MKPASAKSRILGRLISVLLIPVVLSSSVTTVYVSADDEVAVETQVSESNQETTETVEETVEETTETVEETVEGTGETEEVEGTGETEEVEGTSETEEGAEVTEGEEISEGTEAVEIPEEEVPTTETPEEEITEETEETEEEAEETETETISAEELMERFGFSSEDDFWSAVDLSDDELKERYGLSDEDIADFRSWYEQYQAEMLGASLVETDALGAGINTDSIMVVVKQIVNDSESGGTMGHAVPQATVMANGRSISSGIFSEVLPIPERVELNRDDENVSVSFDIKAPTGYELAKASFNGVSNNDIGASSTTLECTFENGVDAESVYELIYELRRIEVNIDGITCGGGDGSYTVSGNGTVFYSTDASKLKVALTASQVEGSFAKIVFDDGRTDDMTYQNGAFEWIPSDYGTYKITKIVVYHDEDDDHPQEKTLSRTVCYYSANEVGELIKEATVDSGDWYNTSNLGNSYTITYTGQTARELKGIGVECIGVEGNVLSKSFTSAFNAETRKYDVEATFTFDTENNYNEKRYNFTYQYIGASKVALDTHIVKVDVTGYSSESISGNVYAVRRRHNKTIYFELTVPAEKVAYDAGKESGLDYIECQIDIYFKGWFGDTWIDTVDGCHFDIDCDHLATDEDGNVVIKRRIIPSFFISELDKYGAIEYRLQKIEAHDRAGNSGERNYTDDTPGYCDDTLPPTVKYDIQGGVEKEVDGQGTISFSQEDITGQVIVNDFSIDTEYTRVVNNDDEDHWNDGNMIIDPAVNTSSRDNTRVVQQVYSVRTVSESTDSYKYQLKTYAKDKKEPDEEGNTDGDELLPSPLSKQIVVDKATPKPSIAIGNGYQRYYNSHVAINVKVEERWLDKDASYVLVSRRDENGALNEEYVRLNGSAWQGEYGGTEFTATWTTDAEGTYQVTVHAVDLSGRVAEDIKSEIFTVDTTPVVIVDPIAFDNNDVRNGKYYNAGRKATITVKDLSFDTSSVIDVKSKYGQAEVGPWIPDGDAETATTYTAIVTFAEDGYYSFSITAKDLAQNPASVKEVEEFVIDKTAPNIKVAYDFNEPRNGMYYRTERTATVDIEDISFNSDLVKVSSQPLADATELPQLGGFTSDDKKNYAHMSFAADGTYGYIINCEDLAGNTASAFTSDVFVIDTTAPEVKFAGVENFSANNGTVAPSVTYVDKYMDMDATVVTMTGSNNGAVELGSQIAPTENGFVVSYADFERVKKMDDLYTLEATVYDLAGNETKEQLVFSVNRFGSVFVLGDAAKALNEEYYTNEPKDVAITEINVDELTYKDVSISRDGDVKELKNGKQYQVTKQGSDTSWKTYTYTISKDNFKKDGVYSVTVYTKDRATNVQDNKSRDAEINFAVDQTAPSIVAAGLESGETYKETSHTVNIDVTDNMGVTNLTVYKDGKEISAYDADALEAAGGVESITLNESENKQTITIVAEDVAGNVETVVYDNILVSTKETKSIEDDPSATSHTTDDGETNTINRPVRVAIFMILALGIVAAGAGAGVTIYKKKSADQ